MDWVKLLTPLITALYWPAVVLIAIIVFRYQLRSLLGRLTTYKGLGQELTFGKEIERTEASVNDARESIERKTGSTVEQNLSAEPNPLALLADGNPSFVITQAWERVLAVLAHLASSAGARTKGGSRTDPVTSLHILKRRGIVTSEFVTAVTALLNRRNDVAHGRSNPTAGEALAYSDAAEEMIKTIRLIISDVNENMGMPLP